MSNVAIAPFTDLGTAANVVLQKADAARRKQIADGIYFGLDEDAYHADAALGSTDMNKLAYSPADYWFGSSLNPLREPREQTPAMLKGSAVHKFVLEGRQAFDRAYGRCEHPGNIKAGKIEREDFEAGGKTPLRDRDFDRILQAGTMIRSNPALSESFEGGQAEVSVFWTDDLGIRKKARLDYLKVRAIVDLKSIENSRNIALPEACRRAISDRRLDVQAAHYLDAREAMQALWKAGLVTGAVDEKWLERAANGTSFAWVWVFWQSKGAPLTWATKLSPGNPIFDIAKVALRRAEQNFLEYMRRFGPSTPWVIEEPVEELDITDLPQWHARG